MFTHEMTIDTTYSIHQLKLDLADNNMHIYDFSDESFVFHEELFWTKAFLRPMVKCITKKGNTIGLRFYLRKIDNLLLSLYLATCGTIALLTILIEAAEELPLVIILWAAISLLIFWLYFKNNCNRITKKIVSLQK